MVSDQNQMRSKIFSDQTNDRLNPPPIRPTPTEINYDQTIAIRKWPL